MNNMTENTNGSLVISRDVIATIAYGAAKEVKGVVDVLPVMVDIKGLVTKGKVGKVFVPAGVSLKENTAEVNLKVIIDDKVKIPAVCAEIQESCKSAIQNMTSIAVSSVNVLVAGIDFDQQNA